MFLYKRKNGNYYVHYEMDGIRKAISTRIKKKSEALKFLRNINAEIKKRQKLNYIPIALNDYYWEFLNHSERIHAEKTHKTFKTTFKYFQEFIGKCNLGDIKEIDIEDYIE